MSGHKDYTGAKMGMWLFLFSELLLFGGLFVLYATFLKRYPTEFHEGGLELNTVLGTVNTVVLLSSSLTVALSITALQKGNKKLCLGLLGFTLTAALTFLVIKYFEWGAKIGHGLFPDSTYLATKPLGEQVFFGLYYTITGLHGLHVLIGGIVLGVVMWLVAKDRVTADDYVKLENAGLYWHLVDLIWIYVFPLFYLIV